MIVTEVITIEGAMPSSVAITLDVLHMANSVRRRDGRPPAFNVRLNGSGASNFAPFLYDPPDAGGPPALVIIPAQGLSKAASIPERLAEPDAEEARRAIRAGAAQGAAIASSCTGTLLLASTGLLDGRRATTAWWLAPLFRELFPKVKLDSRDLVMTDGDFTTAGAAMAQMDLMVGVVARYAGAAVAEGCTRTMILDERRSQTPYMAINLLAAADDSISRAAAYARPRLEQGLTVSDLAASAGLTPRTFARRVRKVTGVSPVGFLQKLRVERAVELAESTRLPFEEIARRVGYAEPSTLRALFRRLHNVGPRELRLRSLKTSSSA